MGNGSIDAGDSLGRFSVGAVPLAMQNKGWPNGRAMQLKWFGGTAFDSATWPGDAGDGNPWPSPDTTTIKMSWVLGYSRAQDAYDEIFDNEIYKSAASRPFIRALADDYLGGASSGNFGSMTKPFPALHEEHINYQPVGSSYYYYYTYLDDLTAALGRFSLYVLVKGSAARVGSGGICVRITQIGVYAYDKFEFSVNPSQGLADIIHEAGREARLSSQNVEMCVSVRVSLLGIGKARKLRAEICRFSHF